MGNALSWDSKCFLVWIEKALVGSFLALIFFIPISTAAVEICSVLLIVFFLCKSGIVCLYQKGNSLKHSAGAHVWSVFLVTWIVISLGSILINGHYLLGFKALIGKILQNVLIFYIFIRTMNSPRKLWLAFQVLMVTVLLISINGIFQHHMGWDFLRHSQMAHGRISSSLREPTDFAAYIVLSLPVIISVWLGKLKQPSIKEKKTDFLSSRWLLGVNVVLAVLCLGWAYSRAGWIVFFLAAGSIVLYQKYGRRAFFALAVMFVAFFGYLIIKERAHLDLSTVFHLTGRGNYWREAIHMIKDHPWFGVGLNAYSVRGEEYKISWGGYPHNCYLQMAAEIGIPGLLAFLGVIGSLFYSVYKKFRQWPEDRYKDMLVGLTAGLGAFLLHSFFDTFFYSTQLSAMMWLVMGWIVALARLKDSPESRI